MTRPELRQHCIAATKAMEEIAHFWRAKIDDRTFAGCCERIILEYEKSLADSPSRTPAQACGEGLKTTIREALRHSGSCSCFARDGRERRPCTGVCEDAVDRVAQALAAMGG
jgi:hypothetical protein